MFTVNKAHKYPFLRKGMGIDLPIKIAHKEWELKPRYLQFVVDHEKRGLNPPFLCEKWGLITPIAGTV